MYLYNMSSTKWKTLDTNDDVQLDLPSEWKAWDIE